MAEPKRLLRLSISVRRNSSLTEDEFNKAWSERHASLLQQWLTKYGIIRYQQYHTPPSLRDLAEPTLPSTFTKSGISYGGVSEILLPSLESLLRARQDPFYTDQVKPDEEKLFDAESSNWTIGWEEVYIRDGRALNLPFGDAGRVNDSHYFEDPKVHGGDEGLGAEWHSERM